MSSNKLIADQSSNETIVNPSNESILNLLLTESTRWLLMMTAIIYPNIHAVKEILLLKSTQEMSRIFRTDFKRSNVS